MKLALNIVAIGLLSLLAAGIVYEEVGQRRDRKRYPQIGRSVDIGGRTLNISCSGRGEPAVIFETSSHEAGFTWTAAHREVSKFTRTCWYDRAGYGWSDSGPRPRTFKAVATDLHALLGKAAVPSPYVLVGAGQAGLQIRVYNNLYPDEVAGVVFADANDLAAPDFKEPDFLKGPWQQHFGAYGPYFRNAACVVLPALHRVGLSRILWNLHSPRPTPTAGLTEDQQTQLDFLSDNASVGPIGEGCVVNQNETDVRAAGTLGDRPLVVLASKQLMQGRAEPSKEVEEFNQYWVTKAQPRLAALSNRSRLVLVDRARQAVAGAVREVVAEVRAQ